MANLSGYFARYKQIYTYVHLNEIKETVNNLHQWKYNTYTL